MKLSTTRTYSKGQVVIPEKTRVKPGLTPGAQFVVIGNRNGGVLKASASPSPTEFDGLIREARKEPYPPPLVIPSINRSALFPA